MAFAQHYVASEEQVIIELTSACVTVCMSLNLWLGVSKSMPPVKHFSSNGLLVAAVSCLVPFMPLLSMPLAPDN